LWLQIELERLADIFRLRLIATNPEGVALILSPSGLAGTAG